MLKRKFRPLAAVAASVLLVAPASAATVSILYTYDALGRVAAALYDDGTCVVYTYDANGNRTAQTITTNGNPPTPTWGTGTWGCFKWS